MDLVIDRLIDKIKEMNNPTVMGLDPRLEYIPNFIKEKYSTESEDYVYNIIMEYNKLLIDNVYDIIPAVKPQIAFYELYGIPGMKAFKDTCTYASKKGMIVIADIKRGDIGSTAKAYSNTYIGKVMVDGELKTMYDIDMATVNPYFGIDGIKPFIDDVKGNDKGIFILVKTSNSSSGEIQDLKIEDGKTIYEEVGSLVEKWGLDVIGKHGYSSIGAVVGATYPEQLRELRKLMPHIFFLIPGYGAQGGKAEDIALGFDENGLGGIVNASRSLMCAINSDLWKDKFTEEEFYLATREEAFRMKEELTKSIELRKKA